MYFEGRRKSIYKFVGRRKSFSEVEIDWHTWNQFSVYFSICFHLVYETNDTWSKGCCQFLSQKFRTCSEWMFVTSCYCIWPCQRTKSSFRCVPLTSRAISEMWTASKKLAVSHKCMGDNWAGKQRNLSLQFTIIYRNPRPWFISEVSWMLYHWAALFNNNYYTYSGCGVK